MAGGSGERFWPVSTKENPKQFLRLSDPNVTLIEQACARASALVGSDQVFIATGKHLSEKSQQVTGIPFERILAEPHKRNTAGCLIWVTANLMAQEQNWQDITLAVLTADQRIEPEDKFVSTLNIAMELAEGQDSIATIGIRPSRPETGFGYIELGSSSGGGYEVARFKEKPDLETAQFYLSSGNFLWNSGMFFFRLKTLMRELENQNPEMADKCQQISRALAQGNVELAESLFEQLPNISIDFAVMENASPMVVVEAQFDWDDLGTWDALARSLPADENGNVSVGELRTIESSGNIVYSDHDVQVHLLGVSDLVLVIAGSKVMVCPKNRAQEVKRLIQE